MKAISRVPTWIKVSAAVGFLALEFVLNTRQIISHEDIRNSNFAKFWIAGNMVANALNPYDPAEWRAEHLSIGTTTVPDKIFLYPLPQAYFLVPLAWLPIEQAFLLWSIVSQVVIALSCYLLLRSTSTAVAKRLIIPIMLFALFFGPVYLSLQIGSIGALALAIVVASILALDKGWDLQAGLLLSFLMLKPSQGLPILGLVGLWFLFRRNYRAIFGMLCGGVVLLLSGLLYDPKWIPEFLDNSELVSARTLGIQSNVFSFAYLACGRSDACGQIVGIVSALLLLTLAAFFLWRQRDRLSPWDAFNIIIPVGFLSTLYVWSYDQLLYLIPIAWIAATLFARYHSYVPVIALLIGLDVVAFAALGVQAYTQKDLLSVLTTLLVLGLCLWLLQGQKTTELQHDARAPA